MGVCRPLLSLYLALAAAGAQVPVSVDMLTRIDGGLGGFLARGERRGEFHIEVTGTRARLVAERMPGNTAVGLPYGSAAEQALLLDLEAWCAETFSAEERAALLAPERLPTPTDQASDRAHQRASLLRTLHLYREVTRPRIDRVIPGRGTVTLSMRLQLGDGAPGQVLWRRFGDDAFARLHLGTETEPLALDSRAERRVLLGTAIWLAARLDGHAALWEVALDDVPTEVRPVLEAWRAYQEATSPRLRGAGTIMDAGNRGSKVFYVSDARDDVRTFRFDFAAGTQTPGRLYEGGELVALSSPAEATVLAVLDRAAKLRRGFLGEAADTDGQLASLEQELAAYREAFHARK